MASAQTAIPAGSIQLLPLLHLHRDVQVSSRWLKGTSKCLGFLMRWGVVCVRLCVGGLAPKDSPATPFPVPSHRRRPSSPSEDPPPLPFPPLPLFLLPCCLLTLLSPGPGLSGFLSGRGKQTASFMHPRIFLLCLVMTRCINEKEDGGMI